MLADPDIPKHAARTAADKGLIRPEEFRKNAVEVLGWELWDNKTPSK
jgi:hypothetical protein